MTTRAKLALVTIALFALVMAAYAPALRGVFVWDDHSLIETNPLVDHGTVTEIFRQSYWTANPLSDVRPVYYRPLTMLSLRIDYAIAGAEAAAFHLTNLFFHLYATVALLFTARRFGASPVASTVAAGTWALHPRSTECVAWIAGRTDLLAVGFGIAAVGLWPWYADANADAANEDDGARGRWRAGLSSFALLLALLSKEVAIIAVPAMVAGSAVGVPRNAWRRVLRRLAWLAVPFGAYLVLRSMATRSDNTRLTSLGAETRAGTVLEAIGRYFEMTLDPWHPATSIGLVGELDWKRVALGGLVVLVSAAFIARAVVRSRRAARGAPPAPPSLAHVALVVSSVLGIGSLALVVHLIPIVLAAGVVADRLLYMPLAALALGLAVASARLSPRGRRLATAGAAALAITFVPATRARARDYTDELLFRVVAAENSHPHNTSAKSGLANTLRADSEVDLACRLHASVRRALEHEPHPTGPRYLRALENLAGCYAVLGDYERAGSVYAELLALRPDSGRIHMEIGFLRLHTFALDDAEASFRRAIELEPTLDTARQALADLPHVRAGLTIFGTGDARAGDPVAWARLLTNLGRVPDAKKAWLAIVLDPRSPDIGALTGFEFIVKNGDLESARSAAAALATRNEGLADVARRALPKRVSIQRKIDALRPRIEALASDER